MASQAHKIAEGLAEVMGYVWSTPRAMSGRRFVDEAGLERVLQREEPGAQLLITKRFEPTARSRGYIEYARRHDEQPWNAIAYGCAACEAIHAERPIFEPVVRGGRPFVDVSCRYCQALLYTHKEW